MSFGVSALAAAAVALGGSAARSVELPASARRGLEDAVLEPVWSDEVDGAEIDIVELLGHEPGGRGR